jgi:aldose 1-epimerase
MVAGMDTASELTRAPSGAQPSRAQPSGAQPSGSQWPIESGEHRAVVVEVGGGLRAYRAGGVEILDGYPADQLCPGCAGQVLAPWPNRIRDGRYTFDGEAYQLPLTEPGRHNAIHGLVNWARWRRTSFNGESVCVEHELVPVPGYPWPLLLRTTWSIGAGGLLATHEAVNLGARPAPFGLAAHPYLRIADVDVDDLLLRVPARSRLLTDARHLPIGAARVASGDYDYTAPRRLGTARLDTAFGELDRSGDGCTAVSLSTVDGREVTVWADSAFGWWQVYTGDTLAPGRRRRSVAVEPMTCPPDAFRSGRDVVVLQPGQRWRGSWGIRQRVGPVDDGGSG